MTNQVIPAEAVEAALRALLPGTEPEALKGGFWWGNVETILEAAAPHMLEDKRGDGDYRPGWDDRKTLSSLWQEHAPLPDEGLSERVYEALIAVATWGYQQRMDEEL
jgi:hypothetical protein